MIDTLGMDIINGKVRLIKKGIVYDLAEVDLVWVTMRYGVPVSRDEETHHICKIPVERSEIVSRLKQTQGQYLSFEVDDSVHPLVTETGLDLGYARKWLKQNTCEHKQVRLVHTFLGEKERFECLSCDLTGDFDYEGFRNSEKIAKEKK